MDELTPIDAVALRKPLRPWRFPNGVVCAVKEIDAPAERVRVEATTQQSEEKYRELLKLICPDATDAEWDSMTAEDYLNLYTHAAQKMIAAQQVVADLRKNVGGETGGSPAKRKKTPPSDSPRSSRTTASRTSAPASHARTAAATGTP